MRKFRFLQLNLRGTKNFFRATSLLHTFDIDVLLLSELKVSNFYDFNSLTLLAPPPGYRLHYESGRCAIIYRSSLGAEPLKLGVDMLHSQAHTPNEVHACGLKVPRFYGGEPLVVLSVYRAPTQDSSTLERFFAWVHSTFGSVADLLVGGDFNCRHKDWGDDTTDSVGRTLHTALANSPLFLVNTGAARGKTVC